MVVCEIAPEVSPVLEDRPYLSPLYSYLSRTRITTRLVRTCGTVILPALFGCVLLTGQKAEGQTAEISSLTCAGGSFTGAGTDACTVTLTTTAPASGLTVSLASNDVRVTLPSTVDVAAAASSATFSATVTPVYDAQIATLTASMNGASQSFGIDLIPPAPSSLVCDSGSFVGAGTTECTVTLDAGAPRSGLTVYLSRNDPRVTLPSTVLVAAGAVSATFNATVAAVYDAQTATLTAMASGSAQSYPIDLTPPAPLALACASGSFTGAGIAVCTVSLNAGAPASGLTVYLASDDARVTVPSTVLVAGGASSATFTATVAAVYDAQTATLKAWASGAAETYGINLIPPVPSSLTCASASITGAGSDTCTVTLTAGAPSSGLTVYLASKSTYVSVPSTVLVAGGSTAASLTASATAVPTAQSATLRATAGGVSASVAVQLIPPVPMLSVNASSIGFGNVDINDAATQSLVLTSSGTAPVSVSSASVSGTGFSVTGASLPLALSPGQTATLFVTFNPGAAGNASGGITLTSNCSMGTMAVNLSGTGVQPTYSIQLSWDAPTDSADPVAGYDVYRALSGSSSYQLLNASVVDSTSYTDSAVSNGASYIYYVTSVDAQGNESAPSNQFSASIP